MNIVESLFGQNSIFSKTIYIIIGTSALWTIYYIILNNN
ncbi:MAG: DUF378 domain-containing protein [Candidatus Pacearchaeota archaeon]